LVLFFFLNPTSAYFVSLWITASDEEKTTQKKEMPFLWNPFYIGAGTQGTTIHLWEEKLSEEAQGTKWATVAKEEPLISSRSSIRF